MKKTSLLLAIGLSIFFIIALIFAGQGETVAQEVKIITIRDVGHEGLLRVEPATLSIPKGMVVVWINMSQKVEPQIVFEEGKKCQAMTDAPTGFTMDAKSCYITDYVTVGGTSSLKFIGEGSFDYEVINREGQKGKGKIVVE
jgi:hypothetical protein